MWAALDDPAVVDHEDGAAVADSGQPVGDGDARPTYSSHTSMSIEEESDRRKGKGRRAAVCEMYLNAAQAI